MNKRAMQRYANSIAKIEKQLGKKRDEIREILGNIEDIVEDFQQADENMNSVRASLGEARQELERAADTMSQLV